MKSLFAFLLLILFFLSSPSYAWGSITHAALAEKVCSDFNCTCVAEAREGANVPDNTFKDFINHHCYNTSASCPKSEDGLWKCPAKNNCPAYGKMSQWLFAAKNATGCERWRNIAIASHYFFDTKVFWHSVQDENYYACHEPFETKVNGKFREGTGGWTVYQCGISVNASEFGPWVQEFEEKIDFEEKAQDVLLFRECGWWCRFVDEITGWLISILAKV